MSIFITAYKRRTSRHVITVLDESGSLVALDAQDVVRVKVGVDGAAPSLEIASNGSTDSTVTRANPATLVMNEADLAAMRPGVYDFEIALYVRSPNVLKHAEKGVFVLHDTQTGATGG